MKIIYVDGTEDYLGDKVTYEIYDRVTIFYHIIKTKAGLLLRCLGQKNDIKCVKFLTVYNHQIKAII